MQWIDEALKDWNLGVTVGEIRNKYNLTYETTFALLECSEGLSREQLEERINKLEYGMSAKQIKSIMEE